MRVVTWNVWWRFGPWEKRRHAILAVLRELRPDVVGLQEVWAKGDENLAQWLAGELGLHWTWAASDAPHRWRKRNGEPDVDFGNAVLSRWPIAGREVLRLPSNTRYEDGRLVLHTRLDVPGGPPVPFFTTHLTSDPDASAVRCAQVRELVGFVARHRGDGPHPPVITGDFNAWPDSDEIRLLGGLRTAPAVPGQVFLDAWEYADPSAPSATWDTANPYLSGFGPSVRIDYIHVGPPGPGGLGHVRSVRRAGFEAVDGVWPSDHAAVVADLVPPESPDPSRPSQM
ncbi:endonuclease/exonuclease/phosphatase family protein [Streptomyces wuyuanensis]|uniref:endonuclease/exonuclease/phosphatase family protein n=1 Tax=Streptomyces wuyuanensis TaxID=1196353 RepID=UPI003439ABAB